jgi:hypothetical protein
MVSKKYLLCSKAPGQGHYQKKRLREVGAKHDPDLLLGMPLIQGLAERKDLSKNLTDEISQEITRQIICKAKQWKIPSKKMGETSLLLPLGQKRPFLKMEEPGIS